MPQLVALLLVLIALQPCATTAKVAPVAPTLAIPQGDSITKIVKTASEWRAILSPEAYQVLREKGTERPFTGKWLANKKQGIYTCGACKLPLFDSATKFDSGTGWPSYYAPINQINVVEKADYTYGMTRVEVLCGRCDGHLGHVFDDGPAPTGLRYCINSLSLSFEERK